MTENKEAGYGTIATEEPLTAVVRYVEDVNSLTYYFLSSERFEDMLWKFSFIFSLLYFVFSYAQPMVEVTAPENLQEGYKFNAVYGGVEFPVIVVSCFKIRILNFPPIFMFSNMHVEFPACRRMY